MNFILNFSTNTTLKVVCHLIQSLQLHLAWMAVNDDLSAINNNNKRFIKGDIKYRQGLTLISTQQLVPFSWTGGSN